MAGCTPDTARRHQSPETIERAARRFVELLERNPGVKRGVLATRAGSPWGINGATVIKAAKALSLPVAQLGGATVQPLSEERRRQAAIDYSLLVQRNPTEYRKQLAWAVATPLGVSPGAVRRWVKEFGIELPKPGPLKFVVRGRR